MGAPVVEELQALVPQGVEVEVVDGGVLHQLLQLFPGPADEKLAVGDACGQQPSSNTDSSTQRDNWNALSNWA